MYMSSHVYAMDMILRRFELRRTLEKERGNERQKVIEKDKGKLRV